jgi:hypothetical protein
VKILSRLTSFAIGSSLLLCFAVVSAQTLPSATKFDQYGSIGGCDHSARLDNLAIHLQQDPALKAHVVYYGPERGGERTQAIIRDYLVNSRGIDDERVESTYGGPNDDMKEPRVELWLAPPGAAPPALSSYKNDSDTFIGLFDEGPSSDSIIQGEGTGPPIAGVTLATFAEMASKRKGLVPYVVAFNGEEAAPGAWRRVAQLELEALQNLGVETGRVKVLYGGADKVTKIQLWILPEDAQPPVMDVPAEAAPEETVQIGSFSDYEIAEERGERWAFNGFLDVLRSSETLRACIIVRLESDLPEDEEESTGPVSTAITYEPLVTYDMPQVDLSKLVEKWKTELAEKHKIKPERFVVLFVNALKYSGSTLETWIVPAGAALPDPNADESEENEEDSEEAGASPPS